MAGGRPTDDPKETLVAVRLSDRQLVVLQRRARNDGTSLSEALRRCVDEWATIQPARPAKSRLPMPAARAPIQPAPNRPANSRPPTAAERATFKQLFSLFEDKPARRRPRRGQ